MIYLADAGHEVVGLEYSQRAIKRFDEENALTYTEEKLNEIPFTVYHTNEKNIKIYQGDLFDMNFDICGQFDVVFDRGSYVAINVDTHKAYADLMSSIIKAGGQILMEALSCSTFRGPPHCIFLEDIASNFAEFEISTLEMSESETKPPIIVDNMKFVRRITLLRRI